MILAILLRIICPVILFTSLTAKSFSIELDSSIIRVLKANTTQLCNFNILEITSIGNCSKCYIITSKLYNSLKGADSNEVCLGVMPITSRRIDAIKYFNENKDIYSFIIYTNQLDRLNFSKYKFIIYDKQYNILYTLTNDEYSENFERVIPEILKVVKRN